MKNQKKTRFLLIDDDPTFGYLMQHEARNRGIEMQYYPSLMDMGYIGSLSNYDAAIIDYHLENMTGDEVARYFEVFLPDKPIVLISSSKRSWRLPEEEKRGLRSIVSKQHGLNFLFDRVIAATSSSV